MTCKPINKCAAVLHNQSPARATPVTWWWVHWGYTILSLSTGAWLPILTALLSYMCIKAEPSKRAAWHLNTIFIRIWRKN